MVIILSKVLEDPELKQFLDAASARVPPPSPPHRRAPSAPTGRLMTDAEIEQLRVDLHASAAPGHGASASRAFGHGAVSSKPAAAPSSVQYAGVPAWLGSRPFLTADFPPARRSGEAPPTLAIGALPLEVQEAAVMDDLLYLMVGVDGK
jgi:hypothetical protein